MVGIGVDMKHKVEIISYLDRSTPICECGTMNHRTFFGDRRTYEAKRAIFRHLEAAAEDSYHEPEYHVSINGDLKCPICESDLDLSKDDAGLLSPSSPSVINCEKGHEFDAYLSRQTLMMWLDSDSGPFDVSE